MIGRVDSAEPYRVLGWSFRLFPPEAVVKGPANRGSAFNSCLAMSIIPRIDCVYLISRTGTFVFRNGQTAESVVASPQISEMA